MKGHLTQTLDCETAEERLGKHLHGCFLPFSSRALIQQITTDVDKPPLGPRGAEPGSRDGSSLYARAPTLPRPRHALSTLTKVV